MAAQVVLAELKFGPIAGGRDFSRADHERKR